VFREDAGQLSLTSTGALMRTYKAFVGSLIVSVGMAGCGSGGADTTHLDAAGGGQVGTAGTTGGLTHDGGAAGARSYNGSGSMGGGSDAGSNDRASLDDGTSMTGAAGGAAIEGGAMPDVGTSGPASPWPALARPTIAIQGGSATSAGGKAQPGGTVHLVSKGAVSLDPNLFASPTPNIPDPPVDAVSVAAKALTADLVVAGSATVDDSIT